MKTTVIIIITSIFLLFFPVAFSCMFFGFINIQWGLFESLTYWLNQITVIWAQFEIPFLLVLVIIAYKGERKATQ